MEQSCVRRNETEQHFLRALTQANEIVSRVKPGVEGLGIKRIDFAMLVLCEQPSPTPVFFLQRPASIAHKTVTLHLEPGIVWGRRTTEAGL